ncbi:MAG TPA: endolytic transglycosylase MltG [Pseudomonas sp.]|uniref:endolytic transglycosylase MltG n=1 Tax=Pseudomonas sp. TaxID=306 RepID=UPI002B8452C3|nr:endolytic transglycosylase MltG [Pseudomonas sp.]HTO19247.1 endolytic transglycosylase MltG [Pseudomonas sp.]
MIRTLLRLLVGGLLLVVLVLGYAFWQQRMALQQPLKLDEARLLDVPAGSTPVGLINRLERDGLLDGGLWLRLHWRLNRAGQTLHGGEYRLEPGMTVNELFEAWVSGKVVQYSLTLVEGWNIRQLRAALGAEDKLEQTLAGVDDAELMRRVGEPGMHPEGRFFPDTYRFVRGMRDIDLLIQANRRLRQVLAEEWKARATGLPYRNEYEALIMASIIEKETGVPAERGQIAGVFVRRLEKRMRLQTDPTVIYGMGERYAGKIRRSDLREATPYNTYTISGLPPTPIAMVGREAIHAALQPEPGKTLYFVARGDGSHVFSATLEEHLRAVRQYQLKRRADYRSSPAPLSKETP